MKSINRFDSLSISQLSNRLSWRSVCIAAVCAGLLAALTMEMNRVDAAQRSNDGVWESTERQAKDLRSAHPLPANARVWRLDEAALDRLLAGVPGESENPADGAGAVISLPMPEGGFERFRLRESPLMEPALAAEHPEIKSYRGQGVDNRLLTMRCNRSPRFFCGDD